MLTGLFVVGYFMLLDSLNGQIGDQVTLFSPKRMFAASSFLTFSYFMHLNESDTAATLTVYKYSQLQTYDMKLFTARGNRGPIWHREEICIPSGTYQLAFVGTIGLPSLTGIAVDNVQIVDDDNCENNYSSSSEGTSAIATDYFVAWCVSQSVSLSITRWSRAKTAGRIEVLLRMETWRSKAQKYYLMGVLIPLLREGGESRKFTIVKYM